MALALAPGAPNPMPVLGDGDSCALCLAASVCENTGVNGSRPYRPLHYESSFLVTAKSKSPQQN